MLLRTDLKFQIATDNIVFKSIYNFLSEMEKKKKDFY